MKTLLKYIPPLGGSLIVLLVILIVVYIWTRSYLVGQILLTDMVLIIVLKAIEIIITD